MRTKPPPLCKLALSKKLLRYHKSVHTGKETTYFIQLDKFCILSPVWTRESCVLETHMNLDGWRKQLRAVRRSDDINVASEAVLVSRAFRLFLTVISLSGRYK